MACKLSQWGGSLCGAGLRKNLGEAYGYLYASKLPATNDVDDPDRPTPKPLP